MTGITERSDARLNRERILDAAAEIIAAKGTAAEVKEIAERAGVGIGTIYRNFPAKDDLVLAIIDSLLDEIDGALDGASNEDLPPLGIETYIRAVFNLMPRFAPLVMAMLSGSLRPDLKTRFLEMILDDRLRSIIQRGVERGDFRSDLDVDVATAFVANTFHPLVFVALEDKMSVRKMADGYTELVLRALRA
jgi:AcrR family transcriptional regulator